MLPTVASLQFKALSCERLDDGSSFLSVDSAIDCDGESYRQFLPWVYLGIVIYQGIPLVWLVLLWSHRRTLNPPCHDQPSALLLRDKRRELAPLKFLYDDYRPAYYFYEVLEMYRRLFFVGLLPNVSSPKKTCNSSTMTILAPIALFYQEFVRTICSIIFLRCHGNLPSLIPTLIYLLSGTL